MARITVQWMFNDGMLGGFKKFNPKSWSKVLSLDDAIVQLQNLSEKDQKRRINMDFHLPAGAEAVGECEYANSKEALDQLQERRKRLPIVLVPGFVCSGLRVVESSVCPEWEATKGPDGNVLNGKHGKRVWLDLPRLFGTSMFWSGTYEGEGEDRHLKNSWLRHLTLKSPSEEADGVHLEVVPGLDGVKFLDPNLLGGLAAKPTQIFAPVVDMLESLGYTEGEDLVAHSFDWRFAPSILEARDNYFKKFIEVVEDLDRDGTGVILLGHSMGNKTVPYFLNYAKQIKGQDWLDTHIRLWVASAAPLLGASQAVKATLFGDRFGLDAFLSMSEAVIMARSFSSSQWMFPIGPLAENSIFIRRQGVLQIRGLEAHVRDSKLSAANKMHVTLEVNWGGGEKVAIDSSDVLVNDGFVVFDDDSNSIQFAGPDAIDAIDANEQPPSEATILAEIKEWGLNTSRNPLFFAAGALKAAIKIGLDASDGQFSGAVPRAVTEQTALSTFCGGCVGGEFVNVRLKVPGGEDYVSFQARWLDYSALRREWMGALDEQKMGPPNAKPTEFSLNTSSPLATNSGKGYDLLNLSQLMAMEGCQGVDKNWKELYEGDPLYHSSIDNDRPPIRQVLSVHGTALPTDVGYALKLNSTRFAPTEGMSTRLVLDTSAQMNSPDNSLHVKGGIILESNGDGVVPFRSMEHSLTWRAMVKSNGCLSYGRNDILTATMTVAQAMKKAAVLTDCQGFCFQGEDLGAPMCIYFKSKFELGSPPTSAGWTSYGFGDEDDFYVRVSRIPGAEHKILLADKRFNETLIREILHEKGGWSTERSVPLGMKQTGGFPFSSNKIIVFDKPVYTDVTATLQRLNDSTLHAQAGYCIAYSEKDSDYLLLWRAGRKHAALLALGGKGKEAGNRAPKVVPRLSVIKQCFFPTEEMEVYQCSTVGCSRPTYNGQPGQSCCKSCVNSNCGQHGPACNARLAYKVPEYDKGARAEYLSEDQTSWIPCTVIDTDPAGAVHVHATGHKITITQDKLFTHLRPTKGEARPSCTTSGCSRRPWNGQPGATCCQTCSMSSGGEHGPSCERALEEQKRREQTAISSMGVGMLRASFSADESP